MPDDEWKTAARRRLRLWIDEPRSCDCGMLKDESMPQKAHGELEYMTEYGTALRDKFVKWEPRMTGKSRTTVVKLI